MADEQIPSGSLSDEDAEALADIAPVQAKWGPEIYSACEQVRNELLKEWDDESDTGDTVELTPDGEAVCDGAFTPTDLYRIAEAITEAMRRLAPMTGLLVVPQLVPPTPLAALHDLRFVLGGGPTYAAGDTIVRLLDQCEAAYHYHAASATAAHEAERQVTKKLRTVEAMLASVRAVVETERRAKAVGGTIVGDELVTNLAEALGL
jgi:hypothetical protein